MIKLGVFGIRIGFRISDCMMVFGWFFGPVTKLWLGCGSAKMSLVILVRFVFVFSLFLVCAKNIIHFVFCCRLGQRIFLFES